MLDEGGRPWHGFPALRHDLLTVVADEVELIRAGHAHSVATEHDTQMVVILSIGRRKPSPVLIAAGEKRGVLRAKDLLADAARLLWLCWQVEEAGHARQRLDRADSRAREAVLHLLILGDRGGAGRVAAALGPRLTDPIRLYVVECKLRGKARDALVTQCVDMWAGQAWVVRCPVYARHVIVLAPADDTPDAASDDDGHPRSGADPIEDRLRAFVLRRDDLYVGASQVVSLRETAAGYEQAFHALAAAKSGDEQYAQFSPREELAALLGKAGRRWAKGLLAPLMDYVPDRSQDPDAEELKITLGSWLSFYNGAAKQLKIHRNTLSARLRRIERLLGCDVRQIRAQATLHLALRIVDYPRLSASADHQDSVDALFNTATVRLWAQRQLEPLLADDARQGLTTLRTWLASNTRLDMTAAALGLSVPGVRKRLLRLEAALERSLLNGPSARHDLWLALRIHDGQALGPDCPRTTRKGRDAPSR
ncbi:MAG: helix-turn-helix domain-containing protein [Pseudonocardiaceae bacterium]